MTGWGGCDPAKRARTPRDCENPKNIQNSLSEFPVTVAFVDQARTSRFLERLDVHTAHTLQPSVEVRAFGTSHGDGTPTVRDLCEVNATKKRDLVFRFALELKTASCEAMILL